MLLYRSMSAQLQRFCSPRLDPGACEPLLEQLTLPATFRLERLLLNGPIYPGLRFVMTLLP